MTAHANTPVKRPLFRRILQAFVDIRELTLIMLITVIIVVMANINPYFFSFSNFRAVAVGMTPTAIIVIGMAILLASGGFDLSVGSVMALSSTVVAMLIFYRRCDVIIDRYANIYRSSLRSNYGWCYRYSQRCIGD